MNVKITSEGIRYIALFESLTGATVRDCIVDEENDRKDRDPIFLHRFCITGNDKRCC